MITYRQLRQRLAVVYDAHEAEAIARMVYEVRYGLSLADLMMGRDAEVPQDEIEKTAQRLEQGEPVQYVLGLAEFFGRGFRVAPGVLIPRPETQELCRWILDNAIMTSSPYILDIGTGSGCIAITLAAECPDARVTAWDISSEALRISSGNATQLGVKVTFEQQDALTPPDDSERWDVIVSNPPYIRQSEQTTMDANVLDFEPREALFVPDDDPLCFYHAITRYATHALKPGGCLTVEINEHLANETAEVFRTEGLVNTVIHKDQYGKDRFITAKRKQ